jgi:hypothetical protein
VEGHEFEIVGMGSDRKVRATGVSLRGGDSVRDMKVRVFGHAKSIRGKDALNEDVNLEACMGLRGGWLDSFMGM